MKKKMGVYLILCSTTGGTYIGSSINIKRRLEQHKYYLSKNCHTNSHLQAAWNKYGKESFSFSIIEEYLGENLLERERYWIDFYDSFNKGYNQQCPLNPKINKRKEDKMSKKRISRQVTGISKDGEIREFDSLKEAEIHLGIRYTKASQIVSYWKSGKGVRSNKGWILIYKDLYDSTIDYWSQRKTPDPIEQGNKIKEAKAKNRKLRPIKVIKGDSELMFNHLEDAVKQLGLNRGGSWIALNKQRSHKGYKFEYI